MDYTALSTAIQDYSQNSETSFVSNLNNFIIAAEDRIFAAIEIPSEWNSATHAVLVDGTAEYTVTPAATTGAVDVLSVRIGEDATVPTEAISEVDSGPVRYLIQKDYDFLLEAYPGAAYTVVDAVVTPTPTKGIPKYYAISSAGRAQPGGEGSIYNPVLTIRLGPIPDDTYPMTATYYGKTSTDSITSGVTSGAVSDNQTWLSVTFPDVLLYGAMVQACIYMKGEPDVMQMYEKQFADGLILLKHTENTRMENDDYRPGPMPTMPPVQQG